MLAITPEDYFMSRAAGEWRNSLERVITIIHFFYNYHEKLLINIDK
jgi:hypothetical protein